MSIKKKWDAQSIFVKALVLFNFTGIILAWIFWIILSSIQQSRTEQQVHQTMSSRIDDIQTLLAVNFQASQDHLTLSMQWTQNQLAGEIALDTIPVNISPTQGQQTSYKLYPLIHNGQSLHNGSITSSLESNHQFQYSISIFQKTDNGFVCISSGRQQGSQPIPLGTFIGDQHATAATINRGNTFQGLMHIANGAFLAISRPLYVNHRVEGFVTLSMPVVEAVSTDHFLYTQNRKDLYNPLLIDDQGNVLAHPTLKGNNVAEMPFFNRMKEYEKGNFESRWELQNNSASNHILFFDYFEPANIYILLSLNKDEIFNEFRASILPQYILIAFICLLVFSILVRLIAQMVIKPITVIASHVEELSRGRQMEQLPFAQQDEIGLLSSSVNRLGNGIKETALFANAIKNKQYDHKYTPLSHEDVLGNALLEMRQSLLTSEKEEALRKDEDYKRNWTVEGLAKFSDLLRQDNDQLEVLAFNLIKHLVKYLDANQGGVFVLEEYSHDEKALELKACYAYDRKKFLNKTIQIGEGLTGTCFQEKQTTYLKDIPADYINITSGLGEAAPSTLLLIPLQCNEATLGVLELASFKDFQKHEIEFVEKIAESFASTLSSVQINLQTSQLLHQSQQQAEEMRAQEEEMRQNLEEMQSTQDELHRRNQEMSKIQEELDQETSYLYALLDSSEDTIYFKDKDSKFLRASKSLLQIWGMQDQSQIMGLSDFDHATYEIAKPKYDAEQEIIRTGKPLKVEESEIDSNGNKTWISTIKMPLRDKNGDIIGTFGVSRDITNIKETLDKAREHEKTISIKQREIETLREKLAILEKKSENRKL